MLSITAEDRKLRNRMRGLVACFGAALFLTVLGTSGARASDEPKGMVEQPRLRKAFSVSPAQDALVQFKGWVDFPGFRGRVRIDVLNFGNGDSNDAFLWQIEVATAIPDKTATVVDGIERFYWSTEPVAIFQPSVNGQNRWPEGGTACVRFVALRTEADGSESHALLPVLDANGIEGWIEQLVLADRNPSPTSPPSWASTPDYLNKKPRFDFFETGTYYRSVFTLPDGRRAPGTSIFYSLRTLRDFQRRYIFKIPFFERLITTAKYYNHGDLGIGRDMNCAFTPLTQETACYVKNYGRRDGTALFGDVVESSEALKIDRPFATVAMVERGFMPRDAPNKVFFVVYDDQGKLAYEAPLDNKQFNKFIPGNCLVCHGSGGSYKLATVGLDNLPGCGQNSSSCNNDAEVRGAFFLPFDLTAFRFYSRDPGNPLSRERQEGAFKELNKLVSRTDVQHLPYAKELLDGWYGGPGFPGMTFNGGFVPEGWNQDENIRQLYRKVVAKSCRGCHISHPGLAFGTLEQFSALRDVIYNDVCRTYSMPNAEQALDNFWRSSARVQLLNRLPLQLGCGVPPPP
ncbi:MAG: hypothetical protein L0H94_04575 [Nitrospira sp.]|nr:hypothetical protein [Nitrospira sp.]